MEKAGNTAPFLIKPERKLLKVFMTLVSFLNTGLV